MEYSPVKNPKWANVEHTLIECEVKFNRFAEYAPFGAVASGDLPHTHQIFAECVNGKWGPIAEYTEGK